MRTILTSSPLCRGAAEQVRVLTAERMQCDPPQSLPTSQRDVCAQRMVGRPAAPAPTSAVDARLNQTRTAQADL
eukprot:4476362-Amphidinium_carterae.4